MQRLAEPKCTQDKKRRTHSWQEQFLLRQSSYANLTLKERQLLAIVGERPAAQPSLNSIELHLLINQRQSQSFYVYTFLSVFLLMYSGGGPAYLFSPGSPLDLTLCPHDITCKEEISPTAPL